MSRIVLLDAGPLSQIVHPSVKGELGEIKDWFKKLRASGVEVRVPEIADYELRRNLILEDSLESIAKLNQLLRETGGAIPTTRKVWEKAAEWWAECRKPGGKGETCDPKRLDADVILCATVWSVTRPHKTAEVATTNVKHISRFVTAKLWREIS